MRDKDFLYFTARKITMNHVDNDHGMLKDQIVQIYSSLDVSKMIY